jgi:hypothetical protein
LDKTGMNCQTPIQLLQFFIANSSHFLSLSLFCEELFSMGTIRPFPPTMMPQPMPGQAGRVPMQMMPPDPSSLIAQLGIQTQMTLNGQPTFNEALVQNIVNYREHAIPALKTLFLSTNSTPTLLEGLYTASKMADARVTGMEQLYPALTRWNSHPDPTIQMHLARFYRKINEPKTFGPMLATAVNYAVNQYPMISSPAYNVTEEVGETVLNQIATRTAQETVRQLMPYLQPFRLPFNLPAPAEKEKKSIFSKGAKTSQ